MSGAGKGHFLNNKCDSYILKHTTPRHRRATPGNVCANFNKFIFLVALIYRFAGNSPQHCDSLPLFQFEMDNFNSLKIANLPYARVRRY